MDAAAAEAVVARLDLRVAQLAACPLCLLAVSSALEAGDAREIRRVLRFFAPLLWDEGLDAASKAALEAARKTGAARAEEALADIAARGSRSPVFVAVVRRLAHEQREEVRHAYITSQN